MKTTNRQAGSETIERRFIQGLEVRAAEEGDDAVGVIEGYAAVFGKPSEDLGGFTEVIKRGAFKRSLGAGADVRALLNHDPSLVLGRISSGTLRAKEDKAGLKVEIDLPDTACGRDTMKLIQRGDIDGMSFSFRTVSDTWETKDGQDLRTLTDVDLIDVSPVTFPAYPDTSVAARSLAEYRSARDGAGDADEADDAAAESDDDEQRDTAAEARERELQLAEADD